MKRLLMILFSCVLIIFFVLPAYADGDPNVDGGGGSTEDAGKQHFWNPGNDGVRVSIIEKKTKKTIRSSVDFTNKNSLELDLFFGIKNKIRYRNGQSLVTQLGRNYHPITPATPLPSIVSANGSTNIAAVKTYFSREGTIRDISEKTGFPYETLINGDYVLLLEPLVYLTYNNIKFAMTATEAALYDQMTNGDLKKKLGNVTHQNLPLAMFLEVPELGFNAYGGTPSGIKSNAVILSQLGLGTVRFDDTVPSEGGGGTGGGTVDYTYHTDTDVITSVTVKNDNKKDIDPNKHAKVTFNINGSTYKVPFVTPPFEETLVWVKWHTPTAPCRITIEVSTTDGRLSDSSIVCDIGSLEENTPPDPTVYDEPPTKPWRIPLLPRDVGKTSLTWGEWQPWWKENWVWESDMEWVSTGHKSSCSPDCTIDHGYWEDNGKYVDKGNWEYDWKSYKTSLSCDTKVIPAPEVPTAKWQAGSGCYEMKSGYGIHAYVEPHVISNAPSRDVTAAQNCVAVFPEFDYQEYNRILTTTTHEGKTKFTFKKNKYSFKGSNSHYTPIWFYDRKRYEPYFYLLDVWTPAGQLYTYDSAYVKINGDVIDDWNISPVDEFDGENAKYN